MVKKIASVISISWFIAKNTFCNTLLNIYKFRIKPSETFFSTIVITTAFFTFLELKVQDISYKSRVILDNAKKSPYMALYAKGTFYTGDQSNQIPKEKHWKFWKDLKIYQIPQLVKLIPNCKDTNVFKKVIPFREISLAIQKSDKHYLTFENGMSIYFSGPYMDAELINEIQKEIHVKKNIIELVNSFPTIILDKEALRNKYKFNPDSPPFYLCVKPAYSTEPDIPIRLILATHLPYHYSYVVSYKEYQKIRNGYYYKKINNFNIILTKKEKNDLDFIKKLLKDIFSKNVRKTNLFIKGTLPALNIKLKKKIRRLDILNQLFKNKSGHLLLKRIKAIELGPIIEEETLSYNGLILYPHSILLKKNYMFAIHEFLVNKGLAVGGKLFYLLISAQNLRSKFESLDKFLKWITAIMAIIIALLFWIFLHTQTYTIGIYKMYGLYNWEITSTYTFIYLICVLIGIPIGLGFDWCHYHLLRFFGKVSSSFELHNIFILCNAFKALAFLMAIPMMGIILSLGLFLMIKTPADMLSYKD